MPPSTNFKSYEAQARLLAALVASLDDKRLDYKKIAKAYGGGATPSAIEHRFRPVKAQAEFIHTILNEGKDPGDYAVIDLKTKDEIQQYFGASTADGINFQFRSIKQGANVLKNAVENGNDPVAAFAGHLGNGSSSVPATPTPKRARPAKTPASGRAGTPASKRRKATPIKPDPQFTDSDSPDVDYDDLDQSPTKNLVKVKETPRRNPGELLPRSAWAKPAPGTGTPARSSLAMASSSKSVAVSGAANGMRTPSYTAASFTAALTTNAPAAGGTMLNTGSYAGSASRGTVPDLSTATFVDLSGSPPTTATSTTATAANHGNNTNYYHDATTPASASDAPTPTSTTTITGAVGVSSAATTLFDPTLKMEYPADTGNFAAAMYGFADGNGGGDIDFNAELDAWDDAGDC